MKTVDLSDTRVATCWECAAQTGPGVRFGGEGGSVLCAACLAAAHSVMVSLDRETPKQACGHPSPDEDDPAEFPLTPIGCAVITICVLAVIVAVIGWVLLLHDCIKWTGVAG